MSGADVERHLPLVRLVVGRMLRRGQLSQHLELDDLMAVGRWAAWEALRRWDPAKGAQSTYLASYIWGYVMRYQRDESRAHGWHRDLGQVATVASLDAPATEDGRTLLDVIADEQATPDAGAQVLELLEVAAALPPDHRIVAACVLAGEPLAAAARRGLPIHRARRIAPQVRRAFAEALADAA